MTNNQINSNNSIIAILAFAGIITALVSLLMHDISLATDNNQSMYFIIDLLYMGACGISGYAFLNGRKDLLKIGAFVAAAGAGLKAIKIFSWINHNYKYYEEAYQGMGWQLLYLFGVIAGVVAFIMIGLMFTDNYSKQISGKENVVLGLLAASCAFEFIYPLNYFSSYQYNRPDFFKNFLTGSFTITSYIFLIGAFLLYLYLEKQNLTLQVQNPQTTISPVTQPTISVQAPVPDPSVVQEKNNQYAIDMLKKYKELLDMGVITQEEFDNKKGELLDL